MDKDDWELAGIADESGSIDRPVADIWPIPGFLDLSGDDLVPQMFDRIGWNSPREVSPGHGLLRVFVRLAQDSGPRMFLDYARSWGVLGLCSHDLPASHNPRLKWSPRASMGRHCSPVVRDDGTHIESLAVWRRYAVQARTILNVSASMFEGDSVADQDWNVLKLSLPRPSSNLWEVGTPARRLSMAVQA